MEKKLTKYDYIISLLLVLMLIGSAGAFFYGWKLGNEKAAFTYERLIEKQKDERTQDTVAYHQQHLVTFYYTVYQPYREFMRKWFDHVAILESNTATINSSSLLSELEKVANEKYAAVTQAQIPAASPLLKEAQTNYSRSLKLFADASRQWQSKANGYTGRDLAKQLQADAFFQEAKNFSLTAQHQYFASIVEWNKAVEPNLKGLTMAAKPNITLREWEMLGLNVKNQYIAGLLATQKQFGPYYPMDAAIRIDDFIASGQARKLGIDDVAKALDMLLSTGAVRTGDFVNNQSRFYQNENLPQLPFYTKQS